MHAETAQIQVLLEGVSLPASKQELIRYAREQDADVKELQLLEWLPERVFRTLDDVGEMLAPVQPYRAQPVALPHEESDVPPGGGDYLKANPTSGEVRKDAPPDNPPQDAIEQQSKAQSEQKERQEKLLD